jgi:hypothetical protein
MDFGIRVLRVNCNGTKKDKRAQFLSNIRNVSHDAPRNFPPPAHTLGQHKTSEIKTPSSLLGDTTVMKQLTGGGEGRGGEGLE